MTNNAFNLDLLFIDNSHIKSIGKVSSLSIFESASNDFHPDGLFSTEIFGRVGSTERNSKYGYVDLKIKVIHPLLYKHIISFKKLYHNILLGKSYAVFDNRIKDFVASDANTGKTGYEFFISNFNKIRIDDNGSEGRAFKIKLLSKYKNDDMLLDKFLVLPAGLRDYKIDDAGKPSEDEVNDLYRKLITSTNSLTNINSLADNMDMLDPIRIKIQDNITALYDHFIGLMDGKKKFIQNKWAKRAIKDSTRNILSPTIANITDMDNPDANISTVNTVIGLYQYSKAISPITKYSIKNKILTKIFDYESNSAYLIDKKKLQTVNVTIPTDVKDMWMSEEGLNGIINKLAQIELRMEPVIVDKYYLALIYDNGSDIRLVTDTITLPDDIDSKYLRPITYAELIYLSVYEDSSKYPGFLTRYPVANVGSIYPSIPYLKTTVNGRHVNILNDDWTVKKRVYEYPKFNEDFFDTLSASVKQLDALDADFDGDKSSYSIVYTDEAVKEVKELMNKRSNYISTDGTILYSASNTVIDVLMKTLSWDD